MNILLGVICLGFCTGFGYYLSMKYTERKKFFLDFYQFNKTLKTEISFAQNSLLTIVKKFENEKSVFFENLTNYIFNNQPINLDKKTFTEDEINFFKSYLGNIGATDKSTQINFLESANVNLNENLIKSKEQEKKYKSLYIKMGFLIGLIALIILL